MQKAKCVFVFARGGGLAPRDQTRRLPHAGAREAARMRYRHYDRRVFLYAFDLIELDGDDLRGEPIEVRKAALARLVRNGRPGLMLNEHIDDEPGDVVFRHACRLGLEGIVSKRKASMYRSGRSPDWIKSKNPTCEAVRREAEEDWRR